MGGAHRHGKTTRLLLVADQHNAALMEKALRRARLEFEYGRVDTPGLLLAALQGGKWDIIAHQWGSRRGRICE